METVSKGLDARQWNVVHPPLRIQGVEAGFNHYQVHAAFYEGASDNDPSAKDMAQWIATIRGQKAAPTVLPEQAYTVTRILEGIYTSAKTGYIYRF